MTFLRWGDGPEGPFDAAQPVTTRDVVAALVELALAAALTAGVMYYLPRLPRAEKVRHQIEQGPTR